MEELIVVLEKLVNLRNQLETHDALYGRIDYLIDSTVERLAEKVNGMSWAGY